MPRSRPVAWQTPWVRRLIRLLLAAVALAIGGLVLAVIGGNRLAVSLAVLLTILLTLAVLR